MGGGHCTAAIPVAATRKTAVDEACWFVAAQLALTYFTSHENHENDKFALVFGKSFFDLLVKYQREYMYEAYGIHHFSNRR